MKKYQITIEVDETQLKQIYLDQDKSLTEKDLPSTEEMIKNEFDWLVQSGIEVIGSISPINNHKNIEKLAILINLYSLQKTSKIMKNSSLSLESQFEVERLKLHLQKQPEQAFELAIAHFEDYLELVQEYKKLQQKQKFPSLAPIQTPSHARLQTKYDNLQQKYRELLMDNAYLKHQNQDLKDLVDILTDDCFLLL